MSDEIYHDDKKDFVESLKKSANKVKEEKYDEKLDVKDVAVDILSVLFKALVGFGWMMLMLLIISFVSLSYIHFEIKTMFIVSILTGVVVGIFASLKTWRKYIGRKK
ncbi:MAG: hypothetical protein II842_06080 [Butyrivibrio sp.]|nr:hypothetical protein [Butyrivibrio sp.]